MRDTARRVIAAFHYGKGRGQISAGEGERSGALRQKASDNMVRGIQWRGAGGEGSPGVYILASTVLYTRYIQTFYNERFVDQQ